MLFVLCSFNFCIKLARAKKSYSKQLNNKTYQHSKNLKYVFVYMYTQNDGQMLMHTKVTPSEHDTNHHCIYVK